MYAQFDLKTPDALDEVLNALASSNNEGTMPLGGGTNVLIDLRARNIAPTNLISLKKIPSLREFERRVEIRTLCRLPLPTAEPPSAVTAHPA